MQIHNPPAEITAGLSMLGSTQYPLYLFVGAQESVIFEGGVGPMGPVLREQLETMGGAGSVKQAVVTHAHPDHVMAIPMMREMFPGVQVLAAAAAAKTLSIDKAVSFFAKIDDAFTASLLEKGVIQKHHKRPEMKDPIIAIDRVIEEGDVIECTPAKFQVLETPGHSECSLSFHEPDLRILVVSDATGYYFPDGQCWWPNYFTGYGTYLDSMKRLAGLGAEVLCLSHNAALKGADEVASYFDNAIAATESYHQRIVDAIKSGRSGREVAGELGEEAYENSKLLPLDFFQKNCALLVKMSLDHEGIEEGS